MATELDAASVSDYVLVICSTLYNCIIHTARAKAADEKFVKLREVYQKLRAEHIDLLRTNGETQKKLLTVEKAKMDAEGEAKVGQGLYEFCSHE